VDVLTMEQWIEQPLRLQVLALAVSVHPDTLSSRGNWTLEGGDRVLDRRAYRLRWKGSDATFMMWLSLDVGGDLTQHDLLAVGTGQPSAPAGGVRKPEGSRSVFSDRRDGHVIPHKCLISKNAADKIDLMAITVACIPEKTITDRSLEKPQHAPK